MMPKFVCSLTMAFPLLGRVQLHRLDHDGLLRDVSVLPGGRGRHLGDPHYGIHPLYHPPEHRVSVALRRRVAIVEEAVVLDVDEELRGCRMRVGRARHRNGPEFVLQARLQRESSLVLYRRAGRLLAHPGLEAAPLNHETVDDAVKYRAIVEADPLSDREIGRTHV